MGLMQDQTAESAAEAMRSEFQERMATALQERGAGPMVQFRVTRNFFSNINGAVGDEKVLPVPAYRALLATVQPWAPDGPPEFWEVLNLAAPAVGALNTDPAGDQLTASSSTTMAPAGQADQLPDDDLPGAPPVVADVDVAIGPGPVAAAAPAPGTDGPIGSPGSTTPDASAAPAKSTPKPGKPGGK